MKIDRLKILGDRETLHFPQFTLLDGYSCWSWRRPTLSLFLNHKVINNASQRHCCFSTYPKHSVLLQWEKYSPSVYRIVSDFSLEAPVCTNSFGGGDKAEEAGGKREKGDWKTIKLYYVHNLFWRLQDFLTVMQNEAIVLLLLTHHTGDNYWNPLRIVLYVRTARYCPVQKYWCHQTKIPCKYQYGLCNVS